MLIVLIILLLLFLFRHSIFAWFQRFTANKMEDYLRRSAGMPPRPGSREARREERQSRKNQYTRRQGSDRQNKGRNPIIPKEYAEDVEFVEIKSFSQTTIGSAQTKDGHTVYHESQVSDVEWVEIRTR